MEECTPVAGTVVRILVRRYEHVLFVQSRKLESRSEWELPGGKRKWHETPFQTARRELFEETYLELVRAKTIVDWYRPTPHDTYWRYVVLEALQTRGVVWHHNHAEIAQLSWYSVQKLPQLNAHTEALASQHNIFSRR